MASIETVDVSTFVNGDLSPTFALVRGPRAIAEGVLRLWLTVPGTLLTDPTAGFCVVTLLSDEIDTEAVRLHALEATLAHVALQDERVRDIDVLVEVDEAREALTIRGTIAPADDSQPFEFVFTLTKDTIGVLLPVAA